MTNTPTTGKLKCPTCGMRHNDVYDHSESACEMNAKRAELDSRIEAIPEKERCEKCGGQGELFYIYPNMEDKEAHYANCPKCGGTGRQDMPDTPTDVAPTTGANIIHKADTDLDTPPRSRAYFDQFDREGLEAGLEQAENDVVAICKDSAKLKADLTDMQKELVKVQVRQVREVRLRDVLQKLFYRAPDNPPLTEAEYDMIRPLLASGDNAVGDVVEAARNWSNARLDGQEGRDARDKLLDALARLDGGGK